MCVALKRAPLAGLKTLTVAPVTMSYRFFVWTAGPYFQSYELLQEPENFSEHAALKFWGMFGRTV